MTQEYLNNYEYELTNKEISKMTSAYYLLDLYKSELIEKVWGK